MSTPTPTLTRLRRAIDHAAHLLPAQGPIAIFIHHNTLHAFEDLPFEQAVARGVAVFGCQPYLTEERFREALARGRIRTDDLRAVMREDLGGWVEEPVLSFGSRLDLRLGMLRYPVRSGTAAELRWFVAETDALRHVRPEVSAAVRERLIAETRRWVMRDLRRGGDQPLWAGELLKRFRESDIEKWPEATWEAFTLEALWRVCQQGVREVPQPATSVVPPVRHRDLLLSVANVDTDQPVHELLIRFCAAFLDQGVSNWSLPHREEGFFRSFCALYRRTGNSPESWLKGLPAELARLYDANTDPLESACDSLHALGVPQGAWEGYLSATLLALRGWGGMIQHVEERPDRVAHPVPPDSLAGFIAVRLLLERFALAHSARAVLGYTGPLAELRDHLRHRLPRRELPTVEERAFGVFQLAQVLGWIPDELHRLTPGEWGLLLSEIDSFSEIERRRVFHLAYERRFRDQCLDALSLHHRSNTPAVRFQVVTCIDEREESFRRHLEEVAPGCETFGAAGFFGVVMYYKGVADAHHVPLCPVVVTPRHFVEERVVEGMADTDRRNRWFRRLFGSASHQLHLGTRTFALGTVLSAGIGALAAIPLVGRILFPGLAARLRHRASGVFGAPKRTRLQIERTEAEPGPECGRVGFSVDEMTDIAERTLRDLGLVSGLSPLVIVLGHGSHSMNNPHESAHDCGACGGAVGGPNGRAVAQILNDLRVRAKLAERGIPVPEGTMFVGGFHNTCNEYVKYSDLDLLPESHKALFADAEHAIERALGLNAQERCRRFESAPLTITPEGARQHLDARAEDLSQVRPEWGHATNALCVVARRERTRGLFLDRRPFLVSYDPTQDNADGTVLTRLLSAVVPVCGGISLEYYFSHVDSSGYGCGTKLPHNITALLGVMDGAASDLRTGLPWQMVEIHEPVRLLIVCETTPDVLIKIMDQHHAIGVPIRNGWVQIATLNPTGNGLLVFRDGAFRPRAPVAEYLPHASSSVDWYRGWREHLEFAEIGSDREGA